MSKYKCNGIQGAIRVMDLIRIGDLIMDLYTIFPR